MPRYLKVAEQLRREVEGFITAYVVPPPSEPPEGTEYRVRCAARDLGHIINLAVRCNPRQPQGTVRKNIVATAMRKYCRVSMTRETDPQTGRSYNKIHIEPKG